jgi:predicted NBD/HSP70 family sugar kinase
MKPSSVKTRGRLLHALVAQGLALRPPPTPPGEERIDPLGRGELWRRAAIDPDTGRRGLRDLQDEGLVEENLSLSPKLGMVLALSLGTESARGALVDPNGGMCCGFESLPLPGQLVELSRTLLLNRLAELGHCVLSAGIAASGSDQVPLVGVSVAWPSPLTAETKLPSQTVLRHNEWEREELSVTDAIAKRFRLSDWCGTQNYSRSHAINDANAAAISAAYKRVRERALWRDDHRSGALLVVRVGGGIGGGLVLLSEHRDNRSAFLDSYLIEGGGFAGEIAHLPISVADVQELGPPIGGVPAVEPLEGCACKREICLDSVASARAVVARIRRSKLLERELNSAERDTEAMKVIRDAARENEDLAGALRQAGHFIGRSLAGPIMLLNPRQITVTGSLADPALMTGIEERGKDWKHVDEEADPEMVLLEGQENRLAAAHGAGLVVLRQKLFRQFDDLTAIPSEVIPYGAAHLERLASTLPGREDDKAVPIEGLPCQLGC